LSAISSLFALSQSKKGTKEDWREEVPCIPRLDDPNDAGGRERGLRLATLAFEATPFVCKYKMF
jgi:hypothetical protein